MIESTKTAAERRAAREGRRVTPALDARRSGARAADIEAAVGDLGQGASGKALAFAAGLGIGAGGVTVARLRAARKGRTVAADVRVHLLNRVELLTVTLQAHYAPDDPTLGGRSRVRLSRSLSTLRKSADQVPPKRERRRDDS